MSENMEINLQQTYSKLDIAWAAGFYEGEGCIYTPKKHLGTQLSVAQKESECLERLQMIFRFGTIDPPGKGNTCYRWRVTSFERVQAVIAMLWPWLSERRRVQARDALVPARAGWKRRTRT
jgi:hypothetical protein